MAAICSGGQAVKDLLSGEQAVCSSDPEGSGPGWDQEASRAPGPRTSHPGMPPEQGRGPCLFQIERMMSDRNRAH